MGEINVIGEITVTFEKGCHGRMCEVLNLGDRVKCRKKEERGKVECDFSMLLMLEEVVNDGGIKLQPRTACPFAQICISNDCFGKDEKRDAEFPCDIGNLIKMNVKEKKEKNTKDHQRQLVFFKSA